MPYNWSFYHPGPIEGEEGGKWSMINVYGLTFLKNGVLKSNLLASQTKKMVSRILQIINLNWSRVKGV